MVAVHRNNDARQCGALTVVTGQSTVFVNGQLAAVENDQNNHLDGQLVQVTGGQNVYVEGKRLITISDQALPDDAGHTPPLTYPAQGSDNVVAYEG